MRNSGQRSLPSGSYLNPCPLGRGEHRGQADHGSKLNKGHVLKECSWNFRPGRDILKASRLVEDSNRGS